MVFSLRTAAWLLVCLCLIGFQPALADGPKEVPPTFTPPPSVEAWRVRIENAAAGAVEVSIDHGRTWSLLGRVVQPATQHLMGYLAAGYENGDAAPFVLFAALMVPLLVMFRAWSAVGSTDGAARGGRAAAAVVATVCMAFLLVEHINPAYLGSFGL